MKRVQFVQVVCCLMMFFGSTFVYAGSYEDYQYWNTRVEKELTSQEEKRLLNFIVRNQKGTQQERTMAHYLGLRWALQKRDYANAIPHIQGLLRLQPNPTQAQDLRKLATQISYARHDYEGVQRYAKEWLAHAGAKKGATWAQIASFRAYAYRATKKTDSAIFWMQKAWEVEKSKNRGDFLLMLWQEKEDFASQRKILPRMVRLYQKPVYWSHWAAVRMHFQNPKKAYQILSSAQKASYLEKSMYSFYVYLMLSQGVPQKAVSFLEQHKEDFVPSLFASFYWRALLAAKEEKKALQWKGALGKNRQKAILAFRQQRWDQLIDYASLVAQAQRKDGQDARTWYYFVMQGYYRKKDYQKAKDVLVHLQGDRWDAIARAWRKQIDFFMQ